MLQVMDYAIARRIIDLHSKQQESINRVYSMVISTVCIYIVYYNVHVHVHVHCTCRCTCILYIYMHDIRNRELVFYVCICTVFCFLLH